MFKVKRGLLVMVSFILIFGLAACGGGSGSKQAGSKANEVIKLKFADFIPKTHDISKDFSVFFMNRVEELSNGKVEFEYYPGEQLGKAKDMADVVKSKSADLSVIASSYTSDKFPLSGVAELPDSFSTSVEGANAIWKVTQDILLEEEFLKQGVRPLAASVLQPFPLFTVSKKVEDVKDLQGLKIRSSGGAQEFALSELGATPVAIPSVDVYSALDRKTIDGGIFALSSWKPYQIESVAKYNISNIHLGTAVIDLIINEDVFQELPDELKTAFEQAGEETIDHFANHMDKENERLKQEFSNLGVEMIELNDDQLAAWREKMSKADNLWIKQMEKKGLPGQKVYDEYHAALKQ